MLIQYLFYIARIDIISTGEDQVFLTINNRKEAIFIHTCQITGMQPAILQYLRRIFWLLPIALHHLWTLNNEFTHLIRWQRCACFEINNAGIRSWQGNANAPYAPLAFQWV